MESCRLTEVIMNHIPILIETLTIKEDYDMFAARMEQRSLDAMTRLLSTEHGFNATSQSKEERVYLY
jgi:hypothetical protein